MSSRLIESVVPYLPYIVGGGVVAVSILLFFKHQRAAKRREKRANYPVDTVILHQIGRGPRAPSLSPFPLKLETYLRMARIPHQIEHSYDLSSKGKTPWMTYNDVDVDDSQFCIDYLNQNLGVDLNEHLSDSEKAVARAFQKLVEENLYWTMGLWRWKYDQDLTFLTKEVGCPSSFYKYMSGKACKMAHGHGIGRHSQQQVLAIAKDDMDALSKYLGDKQFFMGSDPSEVDCAVFGMLAQCLWHTPGSPQEALMKGKMGNLKAYCERMKETFWPDWDECITHGNTKKATK